MKEEIHAVVLPDNDYEEEFRLLLTVIVELRNTLQSIEDVYDFSSEHLVSLLELLDDTLDKYEL